ncbi:putative 6-phosphogluconolactonase [Golovinomyces cichoracearum]|uniref:Putative 6-phosphogluconolactonase n=1 Tax=Golovinomyces cichoracearum TaxID=62708 RepID=A0A420IUQ9_9PEZI|nr:putative 6-phosphogluconolactonase [Golovinomyces cichoracearum]
MTLLVLILTSFLTMISAVNIIVSSYAGQITSLSLRQTQDGEQTLTKLSVINSPTPQPSWLEKSGETIFLANENFAGPNGSLLPLKTNETGELIATQQFMNIPAGPVSIVAFNQGKTLAVAHYASAVSSYALSSDGSLKPLQTFFFQGPLGPHPRQESPHPHQVILDPSEKFIVVPDLGSDLIRVFSIDDSGHLTEQKPFAVTPGSGPRHGGFSQTGQGTEQKTFFFLVSEIANTVASYAVSSADGSLNFTLISTSDVLNQASPPGLASAELIVSPDMRFVHTSARNATLLSIPNPSALNATAILSDTLQSWKIDQNTGSLTFQQLAPAGGRGPRHFSLNRDGTKAAVALNGDGRVVIYERNVESGDFGKMIASANVEGELSCVIWDE